MIWTKHMKVYESIRLFFQNYFEFNGRSSRTEYWHIFFLWIILTLCIEIIDASSHNLLIEDYWVSDKHPGFLGSNLHLLCSVISTVPFISLGVRRLHDIGRSGWWYLLTFTIIGILVLLFWAIEESQKGENKYGKNPIN